MGYFRAASASYRGPCSAPASSLMWEARTWFVTSNQDLILVFI